MGILAVAAACGASPTSGPSPVEPPPAGLTAPAARAFPAGIDPAYVRTLAVVDAAGQPKRWEGGAFRHCFNVAPLEFAAAAAVAQRMTDLSGVPRTEAGPCNVEWISDPTPGHTYAEITGTERTIVSARIFIHVHGSSLEMDILHEAGHVLGLMHSPRAADLMNASPRTDAFTADERAVLAWMFGR